MRDLVLCFGEHAVQVADRKDSSTSSKTAQKVSCKDPVSAPEISFSVSTNSLSSSRKLVSIVYSLMVSGSPLFATVTYGRTVGGFGLVVDLSNEENWTSETMKRPFWRKKKGFKRLQLGNSKVDVLWDLNGAKSGIFSETLEGFHVTLVCPETSEVLLELGENGSENGRNAVLICRKEYIQGSGHYSTKAQLCRDGQWHDVGIEYHPANQGLIVFVDKKAAVRVRHLLWKFRGNQTIAVDGDGASVELFWDVHDWFFGSADGHGIFMFRAFGKGEGLDSLASQGASHNDMKLGQDFSLILHAWKDA